MHASHACRLPVGSVVLGALSTISVGWLAYYAAQDTLRRLTIRSRRLKYPIPIRTLGLLPHTRGGKAQDCAPRRDSSGSSTVTARWHGGAMQSELHSIRRRFAPLRILNRYVNPFPEWRETGAWEFLYYKLVHSMLGTPRRLAWDGGLAADLASEKGKEKVKALLPVHSLDNIRLWGASKGRPCAEAEGMTYTWIGQSTCLLQMNGVTVLTDPVFGLQPIESMFSPNRMAPMPCTIEELTERGRIDVVLISHNHFDHLDLRIIPHLSKATQWIVPKGTSMLLAANGVPSEMITELSWWDAMESHVQVPARQGESVIDVQRSLNVTAVPSMHWTGRSLFDVNQSLWCSYVIRVGSLQGEPPVRSRSFFFCCDTGYSPLTFSSIGRALGPVDAAAIPIGSYKPRWFMGIQHGNPHDALRIAADVGCKQAYATHWGTWCMSDERWDEPLVDLEAALHQEGIARNYLVTLPFGKTVEVQ